MVGSESVAAENVAVSAGFDLNQYYALIKDLMSPDNQTRNSAEMKLDQVKYEVLMPTIMKFLEQDSLNNETIHDQHKIFSCTLLKNRLPANEINDDNKNDDSAMKKQFLSQYLDIIQFISSVPVKNMSTIFRLFDTCIYNIDNVLPNVSKDLQRNFFDLTMKKLQVVDNPIESLLGIGIIANTCPFWSDLSLQQSLFIPHIDKFFEQFGQKMLQITEGGDSNLNIVANHFVKYSSAFISRSQTTHGLEKGVKVLSEVCYYLIVNVKLQPITGSLIDCLQEIAQVRPRLFKSHLERILDLIIFVMQNYGQSLETATTQHHQFKVPAMNLLCLLFVDMKNFMMRFSKKLIIFIELTINCMAIPDESDTDFDNAEGEDDDDNQRLDHISKQSEIVIDKMTVKAPEFMFEFIKKSVNDFLKPGATVNQMFAGLNILCCAAEGCKAQYLENLEQIVKGYILIYTYDSKYHPKVRYAALTALGQLCSDFGNVLVTKLFDDVVDAYSKALLNSSSERVQCHAFAALNNFIESSSQVNLSKAIVRLTPTFTAFLQQKFSKRTITAFFNTVIPFSEKEVDTSTLYTDIREHLLHIVNSTANEDHFEIFSKSVLAICSLGQHSDKELFKKDSFAVMESLLSMMQSSQLDKSLEAVGYDDFIFSWDIMIRVTGQDFKKFLEFVLERMFNVINLAMTSGAEFFNALTEKNNNEDINEILKLQSTQSSDAIMACQLICTACNVFKKEIGEYMSKFVDLLISLFDTNNVMLYDHAYSALAAIILTLPENRLASTLPKLKELTLNLDCDEVDAQSFLRMISSFMNCVESLDAQSGITDDFLKNFIENVVLKAMQCQQQESTKLAKLNYYRENEDFEEYDMLDEGGALQDDDSGEQSYLESVNVFTTSMFAMLGTNFIPFFEMYREKYMIYLDPQNQFNESDINCALNLWIGILEHSKDQSVILHYQNQIMNDIGRYLHDERHTLLHTSAYGYGLLAQKVAPQNQDIDTFLAQNLPHLVRIVEKKNRSVSNINNGDGSNDNNNSAADLGEISYHLALENCVSALVRLLRFRHYLLGEKKMEMTMLILQNIPFDNDVDELPNCYHFTSDLLTELSSSLSAGGISDPNVLSRLVQVQLDAFLIGKRIITEEVIQKVSQSLQKLKQSMPDLEQRIIKNLGDQYHTVYQNIVFG